MAKSALPLRPQDHFGELARLLALEATAEEERARKSIENASAADQAIASGYALNDLVITDEVPGLAGRIIITLRKRTMHQPFGQHRLQVGSPVILLDEKQPGARGVRGVVSRRSAEQIEVATSESPEFESDVPKLRLQMFSDEVSRNRQLQAMRTAASAEHGRIKQLRDSLLGETAPKFREPKLYTPDPALDASQQEAVKLVISAEDFACVHGPPGTGKTTTLVAAIRELVARGSKVLASAPSNLAVDHLLQRLHVAGVRVLRLGHPARVQESLHHLVLDEQVENHPDVAVARKLLRESMRLKERAAKFTRNKPPPGYKQELRAEARELMADARRIEATVVRYLLESADVVLATLTGIDGSVLEDMRFDVAVIDEAAQATEPACWPAVLRADRVILAGDPFQLPPTILSTEAARGGLARSLMERLLATSSHPIAHRLGVQYRMHQSIMSFSSAEFYEQSLIADASVAEHLLTDLPDVTALARTSDPLELVDTAGAGYDEQPGNSQESRENPQEADLVMKLAMSLVDAGVAPQNISVISPYGAQVRRLRLMLAATEIEVDTIDGFQGREQEAVIISLVRSNPTGEIGFLADVRRMNVAITRARRKLIIVGDSATIGGNEFYSRMLAWIEREGVYRTVWEEM